MKFVPGFFLQDVRMRPEATEAVCLILLRLMLVDNYDFAQLPPRFGLLDDTPIRWKLFLVKLAEMNKTSPEYVKYKAVFLARHGQGVRTYFLISTSRKEVFAYYHL